MSQQWGSQAPPQGGPGPWAPPRQQWGPPQPWGQQGQWGQAPQWGQQAQWGPPQPPGGPGFYGMPPRRRNPLPWVLGAVAVVAIAAVVVVILVTGDSGTDAATVDRSTVRGTAESVLDGYMDKDADLVSAGFCEPLPDKSRGYIEDNPEAPTLTIIDLTESGTTAKVEVDAGSQGGGTMHLRLDGDQWCVTEFRY